MKHTPPSRRPSALARRPRHGRLAVAGIAALVAIAAPTAAHAVAWTPSTVPTSPSGGAAATTTRLAASAAVAPDGTAWVAWVEAVPLPDGGTADTVRVARRAPDATPERPVEVARTTRSEPSTPVLNGSAVAIDPTGRPSVLWSRVGDADAAVLVSSRSAEGAWSAPAGLGRESGGASGFESSIVAHEMADGRTAAAWHDAEGVQVAILGTDGDWGPTETVGDGVAGLSEVDLASDADGRLTAVWVAAGDPAVRSSTRRENGTWSDPVGVGPEPVDGDRSPTEPHVAADAQGALVATWSPQDGVLAVATRGVDATDWTVERRAVPGGIQRIAPDVAFDRFGNATLVWGETVRDDAGEETGGRIRAQVRRPDGVWTAPETVHATPAPAPSAPNAVEGPSGPRIVVGDTGAASVVWTDKRFGSPRFYRLTAATRRTLGAAWAPAVPLTTVANGAPRVPDTLGADALGDVVLPFIPLPATIAPSAIEPQLLDLDLAPAVQLDWSARWLPGSLNLRTFTRYLGTDPQGGVTLSAGGSRPEPLDLWGYRLRVDDAWRDGVTGETVVRLAGTMRQAMPTHFIDIRIIDPTVRIAADGRSAKVYASGQGSGAMNPGATEPVVDPYKDLHLLDLDLRRAGPRTTGGLTRSWLRAPATVASAEAQRYLVYGPGTPYGAWTLTVPATLETRNGPVGPDTPSDPGTPSQPDTPSGPGTPSLPGDPTPPPPPVGVPPATTPERPSAVGRTTGRTAGGTRARRRVTVTLSRAIGAAPGRTYRVVLRKGRAVVASGTLRGRTLRLTAAKVPGARRTPSYRRVRGTYALSTPSRIDGKKPTAAQRVPTTKVTIR